MHVLVTCKNKEDPNKYEGARVFTRFLPLKAYWDFSRRSRAAHSAVHGRIWLNFKLVCNLLLSSKPAKMKKIQSKIKVLEWPQDKMLIFWRSRADNSKISGGNWQKFELIQVLCMCLLSASMKEIQLRNKFNFWCVHGL